MVSRNERGRPSSKYDVLTVHQTLNCPRVALQTIHRDSAEYAHPKQISRRVFLNETPDNVDEEPIEFTELRNNGSFDVPIVKVLISWMFSY